MTCAVRAAVHRDLLALASLGRGDIDAWRPEQFVAEWDLAVSKIWVAEKMVRKSYGQGAVVVGCLVRWAVADEMQVLNVVVAPAARRAGVGLLLLQTALAEAQALGLRHVYLEVRCDNHPAIGLYTRLHFQICGRRSAYYGQSGTDALLMHRALPAAAPYR